ncbi:MAG: LemA family protein [Patescibacteria group bacterium]|jgi:LemA protein
MKKALLIVVAVVAIVGLYFVSSYNRLVSGNNGVDVAWSQVETQLQRRFDLIPNLVESVKGAQIQEQTIFGDIAEARTRYSGATSVDDKVQAANQLESTLARLLVIVESYPLLTSTETVKNLMVQLEGTENRISTERGRYNETTGTFNLLVRRFPTNILAGLFGFSERNLFESETGAEVAPKVDFTN